MKIDLHIHSVYSDGLYTPSEIINMCRELKLETIAITDHDCVSGIEEIIDEVRGKLEFIPAVEMSSNIGERDIHILGYYIDYKNPELLSYFDDFRRHRYDRAKKIVEKLTNDGVKLKFDDVLAVPHKGSLGRPHIAQALLKNGYINSIGEAFIRFLGYNSPCYVPKKNIHTKEAIKKIKDWGGVPVIAHPGLIGDEELLYQLIYDGIYGIEVWHPDHSRSLQDKLYKLAHEHNLVMTGGSDFHGYHGEYRSVNKCGCSEKDVLQLKRLANVK